MATEFAKLVSRDVLARILVPHVADGLWSIYDRVKKLCVEKGLPDQDIIEFQRTLRRTHDWGEKTIKDEVDRIIKTSKCAYLETLITGVFLSYIKAFAPLRDSNATQVTIPSFEFPTKNKFIHKFYCNASDIFYQTAYLFRTQKIPAEQQARNRREIDTILAKCLFDTVSDFIPWDEIMKDYVSSHVEEGVPEPEPTPVPAVVFSEKVEEQKIPAREEEDDDSDEEDFSDSEAPRRPLVFADDAGEEKIDLGIENDDDAKSVNLELRGDSRDEITLAL